MEKSTATTNYGNPCSNDNPEWNQTTQPCPNSVNGSILNGAIAYPEEKNAELQSSYSCEKTINVNQIDEVDGNIGNENVGTTKGVAKEVINFGFSYEMHTTTNKTTEQINEILEEFEKKLGYGVASELGLTDCSSETESFENDGNGISLNRAYMRRSLQKRGLEAETTQTNEFVEVSIEPLDFINTDLCKFLSNCTYILRCEQLDHLILHSISHGYSVECTSETKLSTPTTCTPIHGNMTAWLALEEVRRLRRLEKQNGNQTPEEYLLKIVQSYMENNQPTYTTDDLLHVTYVGQRDVKISDIDPDVLARPIANELEDGASSSYSASKYVGIGVAGIFIAVLLAGAIYSYREGKQRKRESAHDVEMERNNAEASGVDEPSSSDSLGRKISVLFPR